MEILQRKEIDQYVEQHMSHLVQLIRQVCEVPSPTGNESAKAEFVVDQLKSYSAKSIVQDEVGNVLYLHENQSRHDNLKYTLFVAHIDTVFMDLQSIQAKIENGKLFAPSAGDNSANVAALLFMVEMILKKQVIFSKPLLFAFNVGEEGLGNLKGIRHIMDQWAGKIDEVIAIDGSYHRVTNVGVGSKRYAVSFHVEGGHSWGNFGRKNAVAMASTFVSELYKIPVPTLPKTTYNAGVIQGGTAVNVIPQTAQVMIDLRSESKDELEKLDQQFHEKIDGLKCDEVRIDVQLLAERPGGRVQNNPLEERIAAIKQELDLELDFVSSSTDSNIPLSLGVPAITFGTYQGRGAHTLEEYIELDSLSIGMRQLLYFAMGYR